jgi:hypothetical protein
MLWMPRVGWSYVLITGCYIIVYSVASAPSAVVGVLGDKKRLYSA